MAPENEAGTTINISKSKEMKRLYHALAVTQASITLHVRNALNLKDMKKRAVEITKKLETISHEYREKDGTKCGDKVWNPITQVCE